MKKIVLILVLVSLSLSLAYAALYMNDVLIPEGQAIPDALRQRAESVEQRQVSATVYIYANRQRVAKRVNGEIFYFHNDHLGSATVVTDAQGNIVEEKRYDPFGVELAGSSKIGYNSKELDRDTELNYYGARYYAADFGRFVTPDTVKDSLGNPQSLNLYAYTLNNPMKFTDPSGNQAAPAFYLRPGNSDSAEYFAGYMYGVGNGIVGTAIALPVLGYGLATDPKNMVSAVARGIKNLPEVWANNLERGMGYRVDNYFEAGASFGEFIFDMFTLFSTEIIFLKTRSAMAVSSGIPFTKYPLAIASKTSNPVLENIRKIAAVDPKIGARLMELYRGDKIVYELDIFPPAFKSDIASGNYLGMYFPNNDVISLRSFHIGVLAHEGKHATQGALRWGLGDFLSPPKWMPQSVKEGYYHSILNPIEQPARNFGKKFH
ncbi:MAG TPA: RHS repeat-associated core domain-containing protein [Candidatus Nanoarchaeia archaeon]|nr:RHS repeat-associated core domain-containing protein [Candidatus Nanoarchaeia archaeon]